MRINENMTALPNFQRAFTLIEMIVVMTITAILGAAVAVFIKRPVEGYVDAARRAEITDVADTALRRIGRDVRLSLPNSVRVTAVGSTVYLEFLQTRTGGRYRAETASAGIAGDILDFTQSDSGFDMLGPLPSVATPNQQIVAGDLLVVYNLGIDGADAYKGQNAITISGTAAGDRPDENKINFDAAAVAPFDIKQLPFASPGYRFQVVSGPVTYVCAPGALDAQGNATGTLTRVWNYTVAAAQPTGAYPGTPLSAPLAASVESCDFQYDPLVLNQRNGLVAMQLKLTRGNESVSLYNEVHVSNVP